MRPFTIVACAPPGQTGQAVALIYGLNPTYGFKRRYIHDRTTGSSRSTTIVEVTEPGLYERRDIVRREGVVYTYFLVLAAGDRLESCPVGTSDAKAVARELDRGRRFAEVVTFDGGVWTLNRTDG